MDFLRPLINGIAIGITLALLIGPALFVLIQTSIHRGFKSGVFVALGIFLSDVVVLVLCHTGVTQILGDDPRQNFYFGLIGGIVLVLFGIFTFTRKPEMDESDSEGEMKVKIKAPAPIIYILKGFFLNIANPGVWFVWLTALVGVSSAYGVNNRALLYFFIGAIATVLATDTLKCFIANKIKHLMNPSVIVWTNRIVGMILIIFGAYLIVNVFFDVRQILPF